MTETLAIHIRAQNAGMLITRMGEEYRFQCFELLARDRDVMRSDGRLRRQFPGPAVSVDAKHIIDSHFRKEIIDVLLTLDREADWNGATKDDAASRADYRVDDHGLLADTANPRLVTSMLVGVLRGIGRPSAVLGITKRSREEVFLHDDAHSPWRRSALWLMVRVSLRLTLLSLSSAQTSLYKEFMIFFMGYILSESSISMLPHDLLFFMTAKISCRILKLENIVAGSRLATKRPGVAFAKEILKAKHKALEQAWVDAQKKVEPLDWSALTSLNIEKDTKFQLPELRKYLDAIGQRRGRKGGLSNREVNPGCPFQRNERHDGRLEFFPRSDFTEDNEFVFFELADFEHSVDEFLGYYNSSVDDNETPGTEICREEE